MTGYSAIVLAGGKSSRMGRKKAGLLLQGKTFAEYIRDKLLDIGIDEIILSGYKCDVDNMLYVEDVFADKGPLGGIHAGLCRAGNTKAIVLTEDAPLIPCEFINRLIMIHERNDKPITVASCGERMQPLVGIFDKELIPVCEEVLRGDNPAPRVLIDRCGCNYVPFDGNEMIIRGCNTPEEYEMILNLQVEEGSPHS